MNTHPEPAKDAPQPSIPADLAPYFAAAAEPSEEELATAQARAELEAQEEERTQALAALVRSSLLGDDASLWEDLLSDEELDDAADAPSSPDAAGGATAFGARAATSSDWEAQRERQLMDAARRVELDAQIEEIYRDILLRAPEHKVQPSLERVARACELLGDPQLAYRTIHLTGTNGKTSTARMISALLRERGMSVATFTSPHLHTVRERMMIGLEPLGREEFLEAWESVGPIVEMVDAESAEKGGPRMSFFEVFTVLAFTAFANCGVEVAVIEVGMGGRWDATNVIESAVQVITPIAQDHDAFLGSDLMSIAGEKAGILRPGSTLVLGPQREDVEEYLLEEAARLGVLVRRHGPDFSSEDRELAVGGQMLTLITPAARYEGVHLPLHGAYQGVNAAAALTAVEALFGGGALPPLTVEHGFMSVTSPGRLEVVRSSPTVLVDAAHNPHGVAALRVAVEEAFGFSTLVGVFACMADKQAEAMLAELEPLLAEIVITSLPGPRALDAEELAELAGEVFGPSRVHLQEDLASAIETAAGLAESDQGPAVDTGVLVVGSVLLAAAAREVMGKRTV
ncbi:MAG: folylpolyglutamate synthase/dihydrofolate synthase family protein [Buchananella hordeovulneris]|nr:folylpolyglutamate synthase/dihydrofolate synthase family protein [Buchananella hordeovulneris]